jgi:hypothetical protein
VAHAVPKVSVVFTALVLPQNWLGALNLIAFSRAELRRSISAFETVPRREERIKFWKLGTAIASKMTATATVIMSSIRVNPAAARRRQRYRLFEKKHRAVKRAPSNTWKRHALYSCQTAPTQVSADRWHGADERQAGMTASAALRHDLAALR